MIVPYCIFSANLQLPEIATGVCESTVQVLTERKIAALYSNVESLPSEPGELAQEAMRFQSVVQQAFGAGVVLPFRFPHKLGSEAELRAYLTEQDERFSGAIKRLDGMAQIEIKLSNSTLRPAARLVPQSGAEVSGTEYLKARASETASLLDAERQIREALKNYVRAFRTIQTGETIRLYALVQHSNSYDARHALSPLKPRGVRAVASGPWPPSEFIDDAAIDPGEGLG